MKPFFRKLVVNLAFLGLLFLVSGWLIGAYMEVKAAPETFRTPDSLPKADAIVVPGASVHRSGKLSPVLLQRMDAAVALARERPGVKLVVSGHAIPQGYNETKAMKDYAVQRGIPARDVLVDEHGRSTFLTLLNCKEALGLRRIVIVSQGYHLPRSLYIARRLRLEAYGLAVESRDDAERHGREWFSRLKDFLLVRVFRFFHNG